MKGPFPPPLCFAIENEYAILQMSTPFTRNGYNNKPPDPRVATRIGRNRNLEKKYYKKHVF